MRKWGETGTLCYANYMHSDVASKHWRNIQNDPEKTSLSSFPYICRQVSQMVTDPIIRDFQKKRGIIVLNKKNRSNP